MNAPRLLVLGEKLRRLLAGAAGPSWDITVAQTGSEALALLAFEVFDVAVLPVDRGEWQASAEFVETVKRDAPGTELVIVSDARPESLPPGEWQSIAYGCLARPLDPGLVVRTLRGAVERRRLRAEIDHLRVELRGGVGIRNAGS
jgi:DNA-binding NtrC family response regulator